MNNTLPKISIITPVRNAAETIEKAINSIIDQNYDNIEYIIMDGASNDGTVDIIKKYENSINYWESENDGSGVVAQIKGFEKATGDIIGVLAADDFYEPGILKKVAEEFQANKDLKIVSTRFRTVQYSNGKLETIFESKESDMILSPNKNIEAAAPNARFFKKELLTEYNFPTLKDDQNRVFLSNDLEYMSYFAINDFKNKVLDEIGYNYLAHENSLTFTNSLETRKTLSEDKIFIAKKFLNSDNKLPPLWQKQFKKWIKKYRARLVFIDFRERDWKSLKKNFILGVQESGLIKFTLLTIKAFTRKKI